MGRVAFKLAEQEAACTVETRNDSPCLKEIMTLNRTRIRQKSCSTRGYCLFVGPNGSGKSNITEALGLRESVSESTWKINDVILRGQNRENR